MGGSLSDATQVSLTVSLGELHQRLDPILGTTDSDRQLAARSLLGLPQNASAPLPAANLAARADPEATRRRRGVRSRPNPAGVGRDSATPPPSGPRRSVQARAFAPAELPAASPDPGNANPAVIRRATRHPFSLVSAGYLPAAFVCQQPSIHSQISASLIFDPSGGMSSSLAISSTMLRTFASLYRPSRVRPTCRPSRPRSG